MSKATFIFKAIDVLYNHSQNKIKFPNTEKVFSDLVYFEAEPSCCTLDIYKPKNASGKLPLFINIHGGGFVAGDKKYRRSFSGMVANEGFVVANLNYGISPKYRFPAFLQHLSEAMVWIDANADKYGFDLDNVVISGDSAGAHMAAAVCAIRDDDDYRKALGCAKFNLRFKGAALFSGAYEPTIALTQKMILNLSESMGRDITGLKKLSQEEIDKYPYFKELDCANYITDKFPAAFVSHTLNDIFCKGHSPRFVEKLRKFNIPVREVVSKNDMHDWQETMTLPQSKICLDEFLRFLRDEKSGKLSVENNSVVTINKGKKE